MSEPPTISQLQADLSEACDALRLFVDAINATGGLVINDDGVEAPAADESWTDLADAYLRACEALGVEPRNVERAALDELEAEDEEPEDDA